MQCPGCALALPEGASRCLRCGVFVQDQLPRVLIDQRYAIEAELGHGAMGVVYRARDVNLGRTVALKVIAPGLAKSPNFIERFKREAAALASLRNDHVVQVYAMGEHEGACFFAMEHIEGRNLELVAQEHGLHGTFVPTYRALTILKQVAEGLGAVHARGLVHRDVKPANIVIEDGTGRPVLLDFGLARPMDHKQFRGTAPVGSPPYMAPEQIVGHTEDIGPRTDLYALGCTGYELLTGAPPFDGDQVMAVLYQHLHAHPEPLSARRRDLRVLDDLFTKLLEKDPQRRYGSAAELAAALDDAAARWRAQNATLRPPPVQSSQQSPPVEDDAFRVLVVDDDMDFCRFAERAARAALPAHVVDVTLVNAGLKALTAAIRRRPHLIVLDYDMPGINGLDTLAELRALPGLQQAQVLVASGNLGAVERWRFAAHGVKDFLEKPVALPELVDVFSRLARRARVMTAAEEQDAERDTQPDPLKVSGPGRTLPAEVFQLLLAVAWADGTLDPQERDAVLRAASLAGLSPAAMEALEASAQSPVELGDVPLASLGVGERFYVYAMARWIAALNGTVTDREEAMLHVLAFALGLSGKGRAAMDEAVKDLLASPEAQRPSQFDLVGLQHAIAARVEHARTEVPPRIVGA
ncbi:MAG: protein kinase [Deltaproteobacteria bacterium]|nr:protein kinase [Deltaproteobacteria bacterium]